MKVYVVVHRDRQNCPSTFAFYDRKAAINGALCDIKDSIWNDAVKLDMVRRDAEIALETKGLFKYDGEQWSIEERTSKYDAGQEAWYLIVQSLSYFPGRIRSVRYIDQHEGFFYKFEKLAWEVTESNVGLTENECKLNWLLHQREIHERIVNDYDERIAGLKSKIEKQEVIGCE